MWMSSQWNGIQSAFRFAVVLLLMLLWLGQQDDELDD
jgi:predicted small integral membrane protein